MTNGYQENIGWKEQNGDSGTVLSSITTATFGERKKCDMGPYKHIEGIYIGAWNHSWLQPQCYTVPISGSHKVS